MRATYARPTKTGGGEEISREQGQLNPEGLLEFQAGNVIAGMSQAGLLPKELPEKVAAASGK